MPTLAPRVRVQICGGIRFVHHVTATIPCWPMTVCILGNCGISDETEKPGEKAGNMTQGRRSIQYSNRSNPGIRHTVVWHLQGIWNLAILSTKYQSMTPLFNPLTLRVSREGIVCYIHDFENNCECIKNSQNIWRRVVVRLLINISPSKIFKKMPL